MRLSTWSYHPNFEGAFMRKVDRICKCLYRILKILKSRNDTSEVWLRSIHTALCCTEVLIISHIFCHFSAHSKLKWIGFLLWCCIVVMPHAVMSQLDNCAARAQYNFGAASQCFSMNGPSQSITNAQIKVLYQHSHNPQDKNKVWNVLQLLCRLLH